MVTFLPYACVIRLHAYVKCLLLPSNKPRISLIAKRRELAKAQLPALFSRNRLLSLM